MNDSESVTGSSEVQVAATLTVAVTVTAVPSSCLRPWWQQLYLISPAHCTYTIWRSTQNYHLPSENKVETGPFLASPELVTTTSNGFVQGVVVAQGNVWRVISALINIRRVQACPYWIRYERPKRTACRCHRTSLFPFIDKPGACQ